MSDLYEAEKLLSFTPSIKELTLELEQLENQIKDLKGMEYRVAAIKKLIDTLTAWETP